MPSRCASPSTPTRRARRPPGCRRSASRWLPAAAFHAAATTAPGDSLQGPGNIRVGTNGCLTSAAGTALVGTCSSDLRPRTDIPPFEPVLGRVVQLRPVHFTWLADPFPAYQVGAALNAGLVAQEVETVFPEMVTTDARGYKVVNLVYLHRWRGSGSGRTTLSVASSPSKSRTLAALGCA